MTAGPYTVTLWARWLRGTSLIIAHGEYASGPHWTPPPPFGTNFSGNSMAAALRMTIPLDLGTPGAENTVRRNLRDDTGSDNLGPVISEVEHSPPAPPSGLPVDVTARVSDADGVSEVRVHYREQSRLGEFSSDTMFDDGAHGDGAAGDGVYGGRIPGFPDSRRVVFYVEATDQPGTGRGFPVDAPERTLLYVTQNFMHTPLDSHHILLDEDRTAELNGRRVHSNDLLDGAFIFEDERAYYNVGVRYRGSPSGRKTVQYRVRFPKDD